MRQASVAAKISPQSSDGTIGGAARGMVFGLGLSLLLWSGIALAVVWVWA